VLACPLCTGVYAACTTARSCEGPPLTRQRVGVELHVQTCAGQTTLQVTLHAPAVNPMGSNYRQSDPDRPGTSCDCLAWPKVHDRARHARKQPLQPSPLLLLVLLPLLLLLAGCAAAARTRGVRCVAL
jgi:hypothetical protein